MFSTYSAEWRVSCCCLFLARDTHTHERTTHEKLSPQHTALGHIHSNAYILYMLCGYTQNIIISWEHVVHTYTHTQERRAFRYDFICAHAFLSAVTSQHTLSQSTFFPMYCVLCVYQVCSRNPRAWGYYTFMC